MYYYLQILKIHFKLKIGIIFCHPFEFNLKRVNKFNISFI